MHKAVLDLIASYLHGAQVDREVYRDIGVPNLFALAKRWSLEVLTLDALEAQQVFSQEELRAWRERRDMRRAQSTVQQGEARALVQAFVAQGLHVLPLKGYYMKEMYPRPEQRQMGDLDFLIDPHEMEQARAIMDEKGYVTERFQEGYHDNYEKKPFLHVELHRRLLPEGSLYASGLGDVFQRAEQGPDGAYRLNWSDFYLFLLVHFVKHVEWAGTGPRSVLDVYLFRQAHGHQLDRAYLGRKLTEMGLETFCEDVEQIADHWFTFPPEKKLLTRRAQYLAHDIMMSATYGTRKQVEEKLLVEYRSDRGSVEQAGLRYLWSCIFLPRKNMEVLYPVLRRHPALLPACWLVRGGRMVFATPARSWAHCRNIWRTVQRVKKKESER